jgi:hypothetical protein
MHAFPSFAVVALATPCVAFGASVSRLDPSVFTAAPVAVRSGLKQQGCTIPQTFSTSRPENVVRGSFTKPNAKEWAALCSVGGISEVLVFSATSTLPLARFGKVADENFVQTIAPDRRGYSRRLHTIPLPGRGLNGVEDAFLEKASTVWVYERGRWQEKLGGD